ncbi:hypothetical protein D1831_04660 [Lactiplantibacillus garii]|uniref:Uncharacterized protein n=1 Tax=Lactiplantibacillus garii TaxID=2306423 RepID=A0A426D8U0_9LACO|nr:hypothetical protein [Lactiplantibacillus garii]RRK10976.1 hypothetical protein D1831_04660 [Lactiplantibacillus garii]
MQRNDLKWLLALLLGVSTATIGVTAGAKTLSLKKILKRDPQISEAQIAAKAAKVKDVNGGVKYPETEFKVLTHGRRNVIYGNVDLTSPERLKETTLRSKRSVRMTLKNGRHVTYRYVYGGQSAHFTNGWVSATHLSGTVRHATPFTEQAKDICYAPTRLRVKPAKIKVYTSRLLTHFKTVRHLSVVTSNESTEFYWTAGSSNDVQDGGAKRYRYRYVYNRRAGVKGWVLASQLRGKINYPTTKTKRVKMPRVSNQLSVQKKTYRYRLLQTSHKRYPQPAHQPVYLIADAMPAKTYEQRWMRSIRSKLNRMGYLLKNDPKRLLGRERLSKAHMVTLYGEYAALYDGYVQMKDSNGRANQRYLFTVLNRVEHRLHVAKGAAK